MARRVGARDGVARLTTLLGTRCLVLGGGGFLGTNLCRGLVAAGADVAGFGRRRIDPAALGGVAWHDGIWPGALPLDGVKIVFDLIGAGLPASADVAASLTATEALISSCRAACVERIVFASSGGAVYGVTDKHPIRETVAAEPIGTYGLAKLITERLLTIADRHDGPRSAILRIANPYGPFQDGARGQGIVAATILALRQDRTLTVWGDGLAVRDYIHIDDVVAALLLAAIDTGPDRIFNVGSGVGRTVLDVIADISAIAGVTPRIVHRPARPADVAVNVLDTTRLREKLGWTARVPWTDGLGRLWVAE